MLAQGGLYREIHDLQLQAAAEFLNDAEETIAPDNAPSPKDLRDEEGYTSS